MKTKLALPLMVMTAMAIAACSGSGGGKDRSAAHSDAAASEAAPAPAPAAEALPEIPRSLINRSFTGDLDAMIARRLIRVAAPFSRTYYFVDKGQPRGLSYEYVKLLEDELNASRKKGALKVHFVMLPMPRDRMLPALAEGKVDMVVAQLTVTPERQRLVDFSIPTRKGVNEIVVTGPGIDLAAPEALSGRTVFVRSSSSYARNVEALNEKLKASGRPPVRIEAAPESLEDDDLLEMVNAGLVPATVVDDYLARFWKQVFPNILLQDKAVLHRNGDLAVAIRKNSPQLAAELNAFIARNGLGTTMGAILNQRYLQNKDYVTDAASQASRQRFLDTVEMFRKYGREYGVDYLLMAAQGYQESRLDQTVKSPVGAVGVMQVMPDTGRAQNVGDVTQIDPNVHAGVKYMRFMMDRYFKDEPMDRLNKGLFTFAAYNAGPGRIRQLRKEAAERGLDPNVWFGNVEQVAAERIGRETVTYVGNIYKYYVAYKLISEQQAERAAAKSALARRR